MIFMLQLSLLNARYLLVELEESRPTSMARKLVHKDINLFEPDTWPQIVNVLPPGLARKRRPIKTIPIEGKKHRYDVLCSKDNKEKVIKILATTYTLIVKI